MAASPKLKPGKREVLILPLSEAAGAGAAVAGGKAVALGRLADFGFRVPSGFVLGTGCYREYLRCGGLGERIMLELNRKPFADCWNLAASATAHG